eukprot:gene6159-2771_t
MWGRQHRYGRAGTLEGGGGDEPRGRPASGVNGQRGRNWRKGARMRPGAVWPRQGTEQGDGSEMGGHWQGRFSVQATFSLASASLATFSLASAFGSMPYHVLSTISYLTSVIAGIKGLCTTQLHDTRHSHADPSETCQPGSECIRAVHISHQEMDTDTAPGDKMDTDTAPGDKVMLSVLQAKPKQGLHRLYVSSKLSSASSPESSVDSAESVEAVASSSDDSFDLASSEAGYVDSVATEAGSVDSASSEAGSVDSVATEASSVDPVA